MNILKPFFFLFLLIFVFKVSVAQDTLIVRGFAGEVTNRSGEVLKMKDLIKAAEAEELDSVVRYFKRARVYRTTAMVCGLTGGFLIGFQLGGALATGSLSNPASLYIGLGLAGVEIGLQLGGVNPNIKKGVKLYNEALYQKKRNREEEE